MPTPKQVRAVMRKIYYHRHHLAEALNEAHRLKVLVYDNDKFHEQSPCSTLWKTEDRIKETTEKALASAMREEIRKGLKF